MTGLPSSLRVARVEAGLSQAQLAQQVGIARQTFNQIEQGETDPRLSTAMRIARALGKSVEELFSA
ncbi:helix-turn-helix transcriptional regulator [Croceicoccus gelatinilyticus]|uniref:helix-turn-helix transcriptional regulator n=1 Tax=Croceicoccus gelatinilyticus TaxID=2835536 RepID=UPI001BCED44D|nr:helix-turn-helix transcriptional regulator [Croceicoccus gelatinilyticus]MBS7671397.1 helix-turn-helix transcriptional regulator [Croceicoccus gelatinilyticus]